MLRSVAKFGLGNGGEGGGKGKGRGKGKGGQRQTKDDSKQTIDNRL